MGAGPTSVRLLVVALILSGVGSLGAGIGLAQTGQKEPTAKTPEEPSELESLSQQIQDLTTSVPSELAAYALLRLVEANAISQTEQRRRLIEQAYTLAGQSSYPVRMTAAGGASGSTRAGYMSQALSQGLDTISLRTRAVRAMMKLDPDRARELFQQQRPLSLTNRTCADTMLYDPSAYYRSAGELYMRGFTQEEEAKGLPDDFLESVFRDVNQTSEVGAAADLLRTLQFDPEMLARARKARSPARWTEFAATTSHVAATQGSLTRDLTRLAQVQGRASHSLLEAARAYLIANESGPVCADGSEGSTSTVSGSTSSSSIDSFAALNQVLVRYGIAPISTAEVKPGPVVAVNANNARAYWQSVAVKPLVAQIRTLRSGDRDSSQWQEAAANLLISLREWIDSSGEPSEDDFYIEKTVLYSQMLGLTPVDSPIYEEALNEYIAFLSEQPLSDDVQMFWLWSIQNLVRRLHTNRADSEAARMKLELAIQDSPSPSIALYGYLLALERIQRRAFGRGNSSRS